MGGEKENTVAHNLHITNDKASTVHLGDGLEDAMQRAVLPAVDMGAHPRAAGQADAPNRLPRHGVLLAGQRWDWQAGLAPV